MKDKLGQEVNVGDYIVGCSGCVFVLDFYKVNKINSHSVYAMRFPGLNQQVFEGNFVKVTDLSVVPQSIKDIPLTKEGEKMRYAEIDKEIRGDR